MKQDRAAVAREAREPNATAAKMAETDAQVESSDPRGHAGNDIALPDPSIDEKKVDLLLARLSNEQFWKAEDKVAQSWPRLDDLREQLVRELQATFNLEKMTAPEFGQHAIALREKFWQSGGRMSPDSFTDLYLARVLLELGRQRFPEDLTLTDELVEAIQSGWPYLTYNSSPRVGGVLLGKDGKPLAPGTYMEFDLATMDDLLQLREQQFGLMQRQFQEGRQPEFQDFLRLCDLGFLYRYIPGPQREANRVQAGQIAKWLLDNADHGGWAYYRSNLERLQESWASGKGYAFSIFVPGNQKGEHPGQYARRFPSFRGAQSRDLIVLKDAPAGSPIGRATTRTNVNGSLETVERQ
jgi:hypothetical protein